MPFNVSFYRNIKATGDRLNEFYRILKAPSPVAFDLIDLYDDKQYISSVFRLFYYVTIKD